MYVCIMVAGNQSNHTNISAHWNLARVKLYANTKYKKSANLFVCLRSFAKIKEVYYFGLSFNKILLSLLFFRKSTISRFLSFLNYSIIFLIQFYILFFKFNLVILIFFVRKKPRFFSRLNWRFYISYYQQFVIEWRNSHHYTSIARYFHLSLSTQRFLIYLLKIIIDRNWI